MVEERQFGVFPFFKKEKKNSFEMNFYLVAYILQWHKIMFLAVLFIECIV